MKAEIIAVGSELLLGQITNTCAQIISSALQEIGIDVYYHICVGDNQERLMQIFETSYNRSDIIILTGGLGPTKDDLTKETIALFLGIPLKIDNFSLEKIKSYFAYRGKRITENNYKQALIPEGSYAIENNKGTAPGVILNHNEKIIVMLPGPPREMEPMLKETVIPYLEKKSDSTIISRVMRFHGIGESVLEEELNDLISKQTNPTIAPLAKMGDVTIRITAKAKDKLTARNTIKPIEEEIKRRVGQYLYGFDNDTIERIVAKLLFKSKKTISIAESCTGGLMAHKLTNIPGISQYFNMGIVSYSNSSKHDLLNVREETIRKYGAVSEQTAREMAEGVRQCSNSDIGVSITGIAGPDGGTIGKPVGLVYLGYSDSDTSYVEKHIFKDDRLDIKERSANYALHLVRKKIQRLGD